MLLLSSIVIYKQSLIVLDWATSILVDQIKVVRANSAMHDSEERVGYCSAMVVFALFGTSISYTCMTGYEAL